MAADPGSGGGGGDEGEASLGPCPLCGRAMMDGPSVERHHWVPRAFGGRDSAPVHQVCHRMVHRLFDEATLARVLNTPEAVRDHPDMAGFLAWVRRQPADFMDWAERPGRHGRKVVRPARRARRAR